jgi:hypothetical protein
MRAVADGRPPRHIEAMRSLVLLTLGLAFASASAAQAQSDELPPQERWRLELFVLGERHYVSMIAETPTGGEDQVADRFWTGGFDLCPMHVVRRWVHVGGCLGLLVVPGGSDTLLEDTTLGYLARVQLRTSFLSPRYVRGGVDLHYRTYFRVDAGRESGFEVGARLGAEIRLGENETPLVFGLSFRAPLFVTRSDSTYSWPVVVDGEEVGADVRPTRDVRIFTLGLYIGSAWSL